MRDMDGEQVTPQALIPPDPGFKTPFYKNKYVQLGVLGVLILAMVVYAIVLPSYKKTAPQKFVATQVSQLSQATTLPVSVTPMPHVSPRNTAIPPTPTPTLYPGISWKTYTNSQYGYAIKYPPNWAARNLGALEPKIPSYVAFNPITASASSRFVTVSVSTRTYQDQLAIGGAGTPITVASIKGVQQFFQDSNGLQSEAIVLPRTDNLLILRAKSDYKTIFDIMLSTLKLGY